MFNFFPEKQGWMGRYWMPVTLVLFLSFTLRLNFYLLHPDAAWFAIAADKWLSGAALFTDVFEINHPLVTLLHLPIVLLQKSGLGFSAAAFLYFHFLIAYGFVLSRSALSYLDLPDRDKNIILWSYLFLLLVHVGEDFGQKEHLAVGLLLPFLILAGSRGPRPIGLGILVALIAALMIALKPQFLAVAGLVLLARLSFVRSSNPADWSVELCALMFYAVIQAASLAIWPEFIEVTRTFTLHFYNQTGKGAGLLFTGLALTGFILPVVVWLALSVMKKMPPWQFMKPLERVFLAAALGFAIAYWHQRHGILYQAYPAAMLALLASLLLLLGGNASKLIPRVFRQVSSMILILNALFAGYISYSYSGISWATARAKPETAFVLDNLKGRSVYVVSPLFEGGLPIGRIADWRWASRYPGHWMVTLIRGVRENSQRAGDGQHVRLLDNLLSDVRKNSAADLLKSEADFVLCYVGKPGDICLIQDFLATEPAFAKAFRSYELVKELPLLSIYRRKKQ